MFVAGFANSRGDRFQAECAKCGASAPSCGTREEAARTWNTRPVPSTAHAPAMRAALERLWKAARWATGDTPKDQAELQQAISEAGAALSAPQHESTAPEAGRR